MKRNNLAYREAFLAGRLGIRAKILLYLTILSGFMLSLVWLFQSALLYDIYEGSRASQITAAANLIIRNTDHDDLDMLAERLAEENDLSMLLQDEGGEQIFAVGRGKGNSPIQGLDVEEIQDWLQKAPEDGNPLVETVSGSRQRAYRRESFEGNAPENRTTRSMIYVRRIQLAEDAWGILLISARITPIRSTLDTARRQLIFMIFALVLATILVGYTMSSSISEPIIETNAAARELARSRYARPPHSGGYREIAELNDTLVRTAEDLRKVEDLQRELIANTSHDLRTPLTMIQGYAETMRDIPDEVTPENMQIIIDETNRLSSMVNEVLDFSRLRTGNLEMKRTDFCLTAEIREICSRVSAMSAVEGYTVVFDGKEEIEVNADRSRIGQVVYNLVGNALTYTGEDHTVRVRQERRGNTVRVSVADSGEGIAESELPYIWDRYFRSRENHRRAVIGSGLGLNICRGILENHQARYGVDSRPGEGSTFWFELPCAARKKD